MNPNVDLSSLSGARMFLAAPILQEEDAMLGNEERSNNKKTKGGSTARGNDSSIIRSNHSSNHSDHANGILPTIFFHQVRIQGYGDATAGAGSGGGGQNGIVKPSGMTVDSSDDDDDDDDDSSNDDEECSFDEFEEEKMTEVHTCVYCANKFTGYNPW
eukprot:CAMPEP_0119550004 /NCGR_PEP_ID=MMETSP1352-20130426/3625_1 /TAXON_ID=265584 /ORGANISM="Stauroneis constricta, Strain CCMP1120" /LENGTH=157 /DNA_ID=CAMNT_0007595743 /DNA_START=50 /DNA_END=520 /DNA_ORIENTATION=-